MTQNVIIKPYLTEKSIVGNEKNRYTFLVDLTATKGQIRDLIEQLYKVDVVKINTHKSKKYVARSGRSGKYQTSPAYKKAIVQLKDKQTLPLFKTTTTK